MRLYTTDAGIAKSLDETTLALLDLPYADIGALLAADPELKTVAAAATKASIKLADTTLRAPVLRPSKVYCMAANYHSHLESHRRIDTFQ